MRENRGENRLHDRRTKSRKDAVPASESDESSARGRRFGKSRRSNSKSICSRRLWFGTVLALVDEKKQQEDTTWNRKILILGFDFGEKYSQFCCYDRGTHTAVSIPVKEGEEAVEFPTAIAKKRNEETWKTGPDAEKSAHAENGIWLDNLYEICMGSRICQIENRDYTPGEVLGTFLAKH